MAQIRIAPMAAEPAPQMVEMGFLMDAGAVAFTDGDNVLTDQRYLAVR